AGPGEPGYGYVGPKTRAKLEEVFSQTPAPATPAAPTTPATPTTEVPADTEAQLQAQLNALQAQLLQMQQALQAQLGQ
ncbi:MAG: hypothetical protein HYU35_00900, partial [Parcubacteria group bacterium]|nr:hypothetical protein [Parcubacteria group bacterium]